MKLNTHKVLVLTILSIVGHFMSFAITGRVETILVFWLFLLIMIFAVDRHMRKLTGKGILE